MVNRPSGMVSFVALINSVNDLRDWGLLAKDLVRQEITYELIGCVRASQDIDPSMIEDLCRTNPNIGIYTISTDSDDAAMSAGIEFALGDWVLELPSMLDYQWEVNVLLEAASNTVEREVSFQIVPAHRIRRDRLMSWLASKALGIPVCTLLSTSRLSSRQSLIAWNRRKLRHKVLRVAPQLALIPTQPVSGQVGFTTSSLRLMRIGFRTIVHSTPKPLRWVSQVAIAGAILSVIVSGIILVVSIERNVVPGWTTTNLQLSALSFLTLTVLSIISEYIYQIASTTIDQPSYRVTGESLSASYSFRKNPNIMEIEVPGVGDA